MRRALVLVIAIGCGHPASPSPAPAASADEPPRPGDGNHSVQPPEPEPPEPEAPQAECNFSRLVRCVPSFPTTAAYQPAPFSACPRTVPRKDKDPVFPDAVSQFSAHETRAARAKTPDACCYVDFVTRQCR